MRAENSINPDLMALDLNSQLEMIRKRQVLPENVLSQQLALIDKLNPQLNAFISVTKSQLKPEASSPLCGLSVALKDNIDALDFATTAGMQTRLNRVPESDAYVTQLLRDAGATFIGKLNMHEGALGATNDNPYFGPCHNPYQHGLTPGGSSGGSAVAVATGMCSVALGTDTMGSVRIPASYCGIFGLKPSRGAVSNRGTVACSRVMDNIGPMTRSAKDLSTIFSLIGKYDEQSAESVDYNFKSADEIPEQPILLVPDDLVALGVDNDIINDFERNVETFRQMGCVVKHFDFSGYDFASARRAGLLICEADMRAEHYQDWQTQPDKFSPYLKSMLGFVDKKSPIDLMHAERVLEKAIEFSRVLFSKGHFLLMPTAPQRAFSFGQAAPANQADLTSFANQAGLAAVSMPMLTEHPLPAGMQLVGKAGCEYQLLELTERWQQMSGFVFQLPDTIRHNI